MLDQANIDYILPLKRNHRFVLYYRLQAREYDQSFDGHFFYHNRHIFYYRYHVEDVHDNHVEKRNTILFYDPRLRIEEEACYLRRVESAADGYIMAGFRNKQLTFGTMSMIYNLQDNKS